MNALQKEIRRILNGYFRLKDNKHLEVGEDLRDVQLMSSALVSTRLFGLRTRRQCYFSELQEEKLQEACEQLMNGMGVRVDLHEAPELLAVYSAAGMANSYLMTAELNGQEVLFTFYTAKALFSRMRARRIFRKWMKYAGPLKLMETSVSGRSRSKNKA